MLKVRIVEVDRTVIKQLGFTLNAVYNQIGEPQLKFGVSQGFGVNGSLLGGVTGGYSLDTTKVPTLQVPCAPGLTGSCYAVTRNIGDAINYNTATPRDVVGDPNLNKAEAMLQAFERVGLVRTLAEPNLTAVSGEAAKFQAGGEFPVPTGRDNNGQVTVEFKPYGVGLGFTPLVLSQGRISLKISTEYSEITNIGALTLGNGAGTAGTTVPGLNVRRAETMVELPSGGAMMIAGLLQSTTKSTIDSLPGLMQLPVLGALFRSRDFLNNESELVVIVTPYLVKATSPDKLHTPADGLQIANDMQTVLLGRLNKANGRSPDKAAGGAFQGPYGYVVD
jgi:pilus assembly protein CpaC